MFFAAPLWLLALLPWVAVSLWLLRSRHSLAKVSFLDLWRGPITEPARQRRKMRLPPVWIVAALAATFLGIVAAGGPTLRDSNLGIPVTIIIDRGESMSARGDRDARFRETVMRSADEISRAIGDGAVELAGVPGGPLGRFDRSTWAAGAATLPRTAADTRDALALAVGQALHSNPAAVLVLSDQLNSTVDSRVISISPKLPIENVGIIGFSIRASPHLQAMVQVANNSQIRQVKLSIRAGGKVVDQTIDLPVRGSTKNYFINLPDGDRATSNSPLPADAIEAAINVKDDWEADNCAWLVRQNAWPRLEARSPLPAELQRIMDVYSHQRPPTELSPHVAVVLGEKALPARDPAVAIADAAGSPLSRPLDLRLATPEISGGIDWANLPEDSTAVDPLGSGWVPVVSSGRRILVATSAGPPRRVWVGFESVRWVRTPDYVIFWTNVFDWLGNESADGKQFAARIVGEPLLGGLIRADEIARWKKLLPTETPADADKIFWPGLFQRSDQKLEALNCPPMPAESSNVSDWENKLTRIATSGRQDWSVSEWIDLGAIACLLVSAATWPLKTGSALRVAKNA